MELSRRPGATETGDIETTGAFSSKDIQLAIRVQRSLLPKRLVRDWVDIDCRYQEMHLLGGDYATVHEKTDGSVFVSVCDVTGHGLAAALVAGRINSFVRQAVDEVAHPCQVVESLNRFVWENFSELGAYATFFSIEIDRARRTIRYAGCGHPPALLWIARERRCLQLASEHLLLGVEPDLPGGCRIGGAHFSPGDRLLVFTDGVVEARNVRSGECFGLFGMESVLDTVTSADDSRSVLRRIFDEVTDFRQGQSRDDALAVACTFT